MAGNDPIASIYQKIEREKVLINGAEAMRRSSDNPVVQASLDAQVKEARRNLSYLEERLSELQMRRMGQGVENMSLGQQDGPQQSAHLPPRSNASYSAQAGGSVYMNQLGAGSGMMPPKPPYGAQSPGPNSAVPKARPNYSKLDLIKADSNFLGPRFQLMLSQLTFKLSVEKQYKDGIEKLVRLYSDDGDRKSRADAEGRRVESNQKIQLLQQALKRYESLYVEIGDENEQDDDSINTPQLRKPLTGHLMLRIHGVKEVNHALTGRFTRGPETFVVVKVEDTIKSRTKATRTDRWTDELLNLEIDKANEIELTVYDKSGQWPTPIGMLWIRISDIVEEMRRNKINSELAGSQWVTAEQMNSGPGGGSGNGPGGGPGGRGAGPGHGGGIGMDHPNHPMGGRGPMGGGAQLQPRNDQGDPNVVEAWFSLEPVGSIKLSMSFTKQNRGKTNFDLGLGRKGAVRKQKEEVQEQYGHKFVNQQFYSVMRCALCGEFLKNAAGMQCDDCKYLCHKNCYTKVVTKCISKSNSEADPDEEKLNHRIPHRFEPFSNISANWCCHCGYLLPFGRKNARKCSECGLTVHGTCAHLVPDFCGMSMLRANEILLQIRGIPKKPPAIDHKRGQLHSGTMRPGKPGPSPGQTHSPYDMPPGQDKRPAAQSRASYGAEQHYEQLPRPGQGQYANPAHSAAMKATSQQPPDRPLHPPRTSSQEAAAAAAASAAMGTQRTSQYEQPPPDYGALSGGRTSGFGGEHDSHMAPHDPRQQQPQQPQYDPRAYKQFDQGPYAPQPYAQTQPQQYHQAQQPAKPAFNEVQPAQHQPQMSQTAMQQKQPQQASKPPQQPAQQSARRIGLENFNFLAVLGKGNFGKVMLAETKASKKLYAIKVLKKEFIIENDEVESTKSEKRVFLVANKERHPFLLNLHACFQTETRVYFVMEYISGGDLMLHIQRGQFGLKRAQFYASEVCLALKYFHENGVIYRDLKLDNILLTLDGHIKIADYGLCKEDMWYGSTTSTFCGTPEFMAPEILLDKKYGRAVDWWAFGVLIYQMLLQQSPFRGEDEDEIYDAILADEPLYPIHMPRDSVSILQKLLTREPELRLGSGPTDAQEIMSHAFFHNVNWEEVLVKRVPPPFIPTIKNATDTSNFDQEFTSVTPVLTPVQSILTPAMQEEFRGFSYSADFM